MNKQINIPQEWKQVYLARLVTKEIKNGYSPNCPDIPNGNWILSLGNLTENGFDVTQAKPAPLHDDKVKNFTIESGDFLISRSNTLDKVGRTILFRGEIKNCSYPDLLMRFRVNNHQVLNEYLESYLRSSPVRRYIQNRASGTSSTMVKINKRTVEKIPIIFPPLLEQQAISDLMSVWNEAIALTQRLIKTKEKRLNSFYQKFFIPARSQNSHWIQVKIGNLLTPINKKSIPTENCPLYSLTIENGVTAKTERYNREALVKERGSKKYKIVCPNDIVFNPANLRWGAIARSMISHDVVISPIYEVLRVRNSSVNIDFLTHLLTCPRQIGIYATKTEGTLIERMAVKLDAFLLLDIYTPEDQAEQERIAETLNTAQQEIDLLKQFIEKYKTQKRGLMQKLLTGTWRIKPEIIEKYEET